MPRERRGGRLQRSRKASRPSSTNALLISVLAPSSYMPSARSRGNASRDGMAIPARCNLGAGATSGWGGPAGGAWGWVQRGVGVAGGRVRLRPGLGGLGPGLGGLGPGLGGLGPGLGGLGPGLGGGGVRGSSARSADARQVAGLTGMERARRVGVGRGSGQRRRDAGRDAATVKAGGPAVGSTCVGFRLHASRSAACGAWADLVGVAECAPLRPDQRILGRMRAGHCYRLGRPCSSGRLALARTPGFGGVRTSSTGTATC